MPESNCQSGGITLPSGGGSVNRSANGGGHSSGLPGASGCRTLRGQVWRPQPGGRHRCRRPVPAPDPWDTAAVPSGFRLTPGREHAVGPQHGEGALQIPGVEFLHRPVIHAPFPPAQGISLFPDAGPPLPRVPGRSVTQRKKAPRRNLWVDCFSQSSPREEATMSRKRRPGSRRLIRPRVVGSVQAVIGENRLAFPYPRMLPKSPKERGGCRRPVPGCEWQGLRRARPPVVQRAPCGH
jgi:hypothetical protein